MSQTETAKAVAAEERTEETRFFVRTVKAAARRKYTPEEKIRIVLEGFRREVTVSDLCRREGINHTPDLPPENSSNDNESPHGKSRTPRNCHDCKDYRATTNSNPVLRSVNLGPPNWTKSRTFTLRLVLEL